MFSKKLPAFLLIMLSGLFQGFGQDSLNMSTLFHWKPDSIPGSGTFNNAFNEVWGFTQDGKEYAVIGTTLGTHIFNVSDPKNAYEADFIPGGTQGTDIIHRDYHDYNGYLYMVADEGSNSELRIADLSYLPDSTHLVYGSDVIIKQAHNIFIDSSSALLYACGVTSGTNSTSNLKILSLSSPASPVEVNTYDQTHYFHDIYVRNDTGFGNHGYNGLYLYDFSDPTNVQILGSFSDYQESGYNHSGWLTPDGDHYAFADETHGKRVKMADVSDPSNISLETLFGSGQDPNSIPHNQLIDGDHLFVSYYYDGAYVWNISDPANPTLEAFYDTYPGSNGNSYKGCWGVYPFLPSGILLASDMQHGLFVFDVEGFTNSMEGKTSPDPQATVYPNPFHSTLNISIPKEMKGPVDILVHDMRGRIITQKTIEHERGWNGSIQMTEKLEKGIYMIRFDHANGTHIKKCVKLR